jgi:hypothetical protein
MFLRIRLVITAVFLLILAQSYGQQAKVDSLYRKYSQTNVDIIKVNLLIWYYNKRNPEHADDVLLPGIKV